VEKLIEIFSKLGLNKDNGLFITKEDNWKKETSFPNRIKRLIERKIKPDAIFVFDNKPLILFFENHKNRPELHEAIWNFNECPIAIVTNADSVEIFNGFAIDENTKLLKHLGSENKLDDFSYFELVTGQTWEQNQKEFTYNNRVDYRLLKNIEATQLELAKVNIDRNIANALLGKIIFIRYLIDREVRLNFDNETRTWSNDDLIKLLDYPTKTKNFFNYLQDRKKGFDGDLFPISDDDFDNIPRSAFALLQRLLSSEDIVQGQKSLFNLYDFSILPIEFISNVYEKFIGKDNQTASGAFYTPIFLVDYVLSQTVDQKLKAENKNYNCLVLDPACGSGIFLVETLRKIIEKYKEVTEADVNSQAFKQVLKQLATDNIFGVDEDASAVQVAIFSIYLTMLDYLEPADIESFQFPRLLGANFFIADFFDCEHDFNQNFESISFDFIVGNPPWMRGRATSETPRFIQYIENRRKYEKQDRLPECAIGNKEIAQAFLIRSSDFCKEKTKCSLIVTSKVLYNLKSAGFRRYFLHNYHIERVFELAPVRREVFDKSNKPATAPACVLFFKYANGISTDSNVIEHIALKASRFFSLFKILTVNRADFKEIQQSKLKEFDWLWKVLVFGSYLDFNLLNRLKKQFITIETLLSEKEVLIKQGIKRVDGDKKMDVSQLVGWDFLDISKKEIDQLYIVPTHKKWTQKEVGYVYRENNSVCKDMFSPPVLLVKETVNTKLESVSAISTRKILFTDKTTAIKFRENEDINTYYLLAGLINSTLFAYYILNTSSTAGIMIEQQINDEERFSFPFIPSPKVISVAKEIEDLKKIFYSNATNCYEDKKEIAERVDLLNELIFNEFGLSEEEKTLVDYAKNIMIPITMRHRGHRSLFQPLKYEDKVLKDYVQLFLNRFQPNLSNNDRKFIVEIWHTNQIVGMLFKVVPINDYEKETKWIDKQDDLSGILPFLIKITSGKITDRLFVQKDIRGFHKDYFFIFKPNEKRLWHKAVGYVDVQEFSDVILKAGKKEI